MPAPLTVNLTFVGKFTAAVVVAVNVNNLPRLVSVTPVGFDPAAV